MAVKSEDWVTADSAFKRIGDDWNKDSWVTEDWFKSNRDTATQIAPLQAKPRVYRQEAEANMKTPAEHAYEGVFQPKFAALEQSCLNDAKGESSKIEFLIQVGKDGIPEEAPTEKPPTPFVACLLKKLYESYVKKEAVFPPPPSGGYRMILEIDPTTLSATTK